MRYLAKIRNLRPLVTKNTYIMPIQIDITDDLLYMEGEQKGMEKKARQGIIKALQRKKMTINDIADIFEVEIAYIRQIKKELGL